MKAAVALTAAGRLELRDRVRRSAGPAVAGGGLRWSLRVEGDWFAVADGGDHDEVCAFANSPDSLAPSWVSETAGEFGTFAAGTCLGREAAPSISFRRTSAESPRLYFRIGPDLVEIDGDLERLARGDGTRASLDEHSLLHFVWRGRAPAGSTLYRGIGALALGDELSCSPDARPVVRRNTWPFVSDTVNGGVEDLQRQAVERIDAAVAASIPVSGSSVGLLLSGGVDSGLVGALATRHAASVTGYTAAFDPAYGLNETPYAASIADRLRLRHRVVHIGVADALSLLDTVLGSPHPRAASAALTHLALTRAAASDGQRVVLSGLGADECFGGYHKPLACLAAQVRRMHLCGLDLAGLYATPAHRLARLRDVLFYGIAEFFSLHELKRSAVDPTHLGDFVHSEVEFYRHALAAKPAAQATELMAAHEYRHRLAELLLPALCGDASAPVRVALPFLQPNVYHWAAALEPGLSYWHEHGAWWAKRLLREVAADHLPEPIVMRKRQILLAPLAHWLLDHRLRRRCVEEIGDSAFWRLGVLASDARATLLAELRAYRSAEADARWLEQFWVLLVLCAWVNRRRHRSEVDA